MSAIELLIAGGGAVGSRLVGHLPSSLALTIADVDVVLRENLPGPFGETDLFQPKASVLAARHRARGGVARALIGDVRYTIRPGLAARCTAAVLALDTPRGIHDATSALWAGGPPGMLVLALTCGGDAGYLARHFTVPGVCPVCLFGVTEREADRAAQGASCAATSAPRASAAAAEAAARAGAELLARWLAGDRSLAGCRVQRDAAAGAAFVARLPAAPRPACPSAHVAATGPVDELGPIGAVTVRALAERAVARAGADATLELGRRGVPLAGIYCQACQATAPARPLLLPAALAVAPCTCGETPRPLGVRTTVGARELLTSDAADLTLAAWGAGHGDEFRVRGSRAALRLRCAFTWEDLDR